MARALSVDLRRRVVDAIAEGISRRQAAARFRGERVERHSLGSAAGEDRRY
jgi:transposase